MQSSAKRPTYHQEDNYEHSASDEADSPDAGKVQTLWRDVQQNTRQLEDLQSPEHGSTTASGLSHYVSENQELRDKLRSSQMQLNEARDNIVVLSRKVDENEREISEYQGQLTRQSNLSSMKTHQLNRMTTEFSNLNLSQKEIVERSRESNIALINDLGEKQKEIGKLKGLSKDTTDKLSVVGVSYNQATCKIDRLEDEVDLKNQEIASLRRELEEARQTIDDLRMVKKSEGLATLEIEHLRSDVKRLVKMLRTTSEFGGFADFADDTTGSIRFLKDAMRQTQTDLNHKRANPNSAGEATAQKRLCVKESVIDEKEVWMPHEAFKFAKELRRQYNGELTDALLEKLMFEFNRIWSKREEQRVQRIKNQCAHEVMKLQRKLNQNPAYDQVHAKQTIHRLKAELKNAYTDNRKAFAERAERHPPGTHYVNETMKMIKDAQRTKKVMSLENDFLRTQLRASSASKGHLAS